MPLYDYRCDNCKEEFEEIQPFDKKDDVRCPKCNRKARRLVSGFAVGDSGSKSALSDYGTSCSLTGG